MALPRSCQIEIESITLNFTGGLPSPPPVVMHGHTTTNELAPALYVEFCPNYICSSLLLAAHAVIQQQESKPKFLIRGDWIPTL